MNTNNSCPCCSNPMLRHLSRQHSYWFCSRCRIEMPDIENKVCPSQNSMQFNSSSIKSVVVSQEPAKQIVT